MECPKIIFTYVLIVNVIAFAMYAIDKQKAKKSKWRIPERNLIAIAFAGGFIGALCGMYMLRHKTKHKKFTILVPLAAVVDICVAVWLLK